MQLDIIAVGQMRGAGEMPLVEEFNQRIEASGRQLGISGISIIELREKRALTGDDKKRSENALIADALARRSGPLIVLDETGTSLTSRAFADKLQGWIERGDSHVTFVIGGADGLDDAIRGRADLVLAKLFQPTSSRRRSVPLLVFGVSHGARSLRGRPLIALT